MTADPFPLALVIRLRHCLESLGKTPEAVAGALRSAGVSGETLCSTSCPVASWLDREGFSWSAVAPDDIAAYHTSAPGLHLSVRLCDLPNGPAIAEFVRRFDNNLYPDLIAPSKTRTKGKR